MEWNDLEDVQPGDEDLCAVYTVAKDGVKDLIRLDSWKRKYVQVPDDEVPEGFTHATKLGEHHFPTLVGQDYKKCLWSKIDIPDIPEDPDCNSTLSEEVATPD